MYGLCSFHARYVAIKGGQSKEDVAVSLKAIVLDRECSLSNIWKVVFSHQK